MVPGFQTFAIALATFRAPSVKNGVSTKMEKKFDVQRQGVN